MSMYNVKFCPLMGIICIAKCRMICRGFSCNNISADSQLKSFNSLEEPRNLTSIFDYEKFDCTPEINMLANKLVVPTTDPHGGYHIDFFVIYSFHANTL